MNTEPVELDSLFKEQSLFEVYRAAPSFFKNRFNASAVLSICLLLSLFAVLHILMVPFRDALHFPFADTFTLFANTGISLAGTILGFLIAGFAILCTILRPQTMIALQRIRNKEFDCTELRLLFLVFIDIIIQYLALLAWSIIVLVVGGPKGPAAALGIVLSRIHWLLPFVLIHALFVLWGTWFVMLALSLKSFVFNLYQSLLLSIADAVDDYERDKRKSS